MDEGQERRAGRVYPQRARSEADGAEAVRLKERELERVPSAFRSDGEEDPLVPLITDR